MIVSILPTGKCVTFACRRRVSSAIQLPRLDDLKCRITKSRSLVLDAAFVDCIFSLFFFSHCFCFYLVTAEFVLQQRYNIVKRSILRRFPPDISSNTFPYSPFEPLFLFPPCVKISSANSGAFLTILVVWFRHFNSLLMYFVFAFPQSTSIFTFFLTFIIFLVPLLHFMLVM